MPVGARLSIASGFVARAAVARTWGPGPGFSPRTSNAPDPCGPSNMREANVFPPMAMASHWPGASPDISTTSAGDNKVHRLFAYDRVSMRARSTAMGSARTHQLDGLVDLPRDAFQPFDMNRDPRRKSGGDICPMDKVCGIQSEAHMADFAGAIVFAAIGPRMSCRLGRRWSPKENQGPESLRSCCARVAILRI
jgi:hypothetical protein